MWARRAGRRAAEERAQEDTDQETEAQRPWKSNPREHGFQPLSPAPAFTEPPGSHPVVHGGGRRLRDRRLRAPLADFRGRAAADEVSEGTSISPDDRAGWVVQKVSYKIRERIPEQLSSRLWSQDALWASKLLTKPKTPGPLKEEPCIFTM